MISVIKKSYSRLSQLYQNDTFIAARFLHGAKDEEIIAHNIPSDVTWTCCRYRRNNAGATYFRGQSAAGFARLNRRCDLQGGT
jgi:hypothetical protein